jgi:hypothetical protein
LNIKNFHFETSKEETLKCKALPISMFGEYHIYHVGAFENYLRSSQCMQNFKHNKNLGGTQGSKHSRLLFVRTKTFMQVVKKGYPF